MMRIKLNLDENTFIENNDGSISLKISTLDDPYKNGLSVSEEGNVIAEKGADGSDGNPGIGNKTSNGIVGEEYKEIDGYLGCNKTVTRRKKYEGTSTFIKENEGVYIPDIIQLLTPESTFPQTDTDPELDPQPVDPDTFTKLGEINSQGVHYIFSYKTNYVVNGGPQEIERDNLENGWHITAVRMHESYNLTWYELYDTEDNDYYGWVDSTYITFYEEPEPSDDPDIPVDPLGPDYTSLNYIEANGSEWLDPEMTAPSATDTIEVKTHVSFTQNGISTSGESYRAIVALEYNGSDIYNETGLYFGYYYTENKFTVNVIHPAGPIGQNLYPNFTILANTGYEIDIVSTETQLSMSIDDGTNITNVSKESVGQTLPLILFATKSGAGYSYNQKAIVQMSYCQIYVNGTLVHDLVPCRRNSDNVIGMYDKITNAFRTTSSGTFTGG